MMRRNEIEILDYRRRLADLIVAQMPPMGDDPIGWIDKVAEYAIAEITSDGLEGVRTNKLINAYSHVCRRAVNKAMNVTVVQVSGEEDAYAAFVGEHKIADLRIVLVSYSEADLRSDTTGVRIKAVVKTRFGEFTITTSPGICKYQEHTLLNFANVADFVQEIYVNKALELVEYSPFKILERLDGTRRGFFSVIPLTEDYLEQPFNRIEYIGIRHDYLKLIPGFLIEHAAKTGFWKYLPEHLMDLKQRITAQEA
jgi:hypothetical protein